jgi:hypothetical protein
MKWRAYLMPAYIHLWHFACHGHFRPDAPNRSAFNQPRTPNSGPMISSAR